MAIVMTPHRDELAPAVRAMNERLHANGVSFSFPESPISHWLPQVPGRALYQEFFLAVEGDAVRGGYILKHQPFLVNESTLSAKRRSDCSVV